jgi:hypothetical protein
MINTMITINIAAMGTKNRLAGEFRPDTAIS